jgi:hypothetical protein
MSNRKMSSEVLASAAKQLACACDYDDAMKETYVTSVMLPASKYRRESDPRQEVVLRDLQFVADLVSLLRVRRESNAAVDSRVAQPHTLMSVDKKKGAVVYTKCWSLPELTLDHFLFASPCRALPFRVPNVARCWPTTARQL